MTIVWIAVGFLSAVVVWLLFWVVITRVSGLSRRQAVFVSGGLPAPAPSGFYRGTAYLLGGGPVPWLGKSFEPSENVGYNIFTPNGAKLLKLMTPLYKRFRANADGNTDAYYFKTTTGPGFRDPDIETFKLDYDSPENPFLIRIILDEIVETAPNEYLGKVHMKVFPGYYATIGYFGLRK
ncbi:MAG: hypothetical protein IPM59_13235 [Chloracidobacterium sp.]|nr:hypothetical protein [Chloracidobacterium sp.]